MSADSPDPNDLPPATREALDSLGGALGDLADLDEDQLAETTALLKTLGHDEAADLLANRRDVLKTLGAVGAGGLVGAAGVSSATGRAEAGTNQAGTIGTPSNPVDVEAEDVNAAMVDSDVLDSVRFASQFSTIQAAIDDLPADGGTVILPDGRTEIGNLTIPSGEGVVVRLSGYGAKDEAGEAASDAGTVLESTVTDGSDLIVADAPSGERNRGLILENFAVEGTGSEGAGIYATDWIHTGYANNVAVYNVGGVGFRFVDCFQQQFYGLRAKDCGSAGFDLTNVNVSLFAKCYAHNCTHGFVIAGSYSVGFVACSAEGCSQNGFWDTNNNAVVFTDCNAEANTHGFRLQGDHPLIRGGSANTNTNNDLWAEGAVNPACENVYFDDAGATTRHILVDNCVLDIRNPLFQGTATDVTTTNGGLYAVNGTGVESANAETPQGAWREGMTIDFTDSGDGSGTGKYLILRDGTAYAV